MDVVEWADVRTAATALYDGIKARFFDGARDLPISAWDLIKNLLEDLVTRDVPMVFLKQFRDCEAAATACYQAVVEAPAHLDAFHAGWFTAPHDVVIADVASHPIVRECGFAGAQLRADLGFWCTIDFTMQPGRVIAQS